MESYFVVSNPIVKQITAILAITSTATLVGLNSCRLQLPFPMVKPDIISLPIIQPDRTLQGHRLREQEQVAQTGQGLQREPGLQAGEPAHLHRSHVPRAPGAAQPGHRVPAAQAHLQQELQLDQPVRVPLRAHALTVARFQRQQPGHRR